MTNMGVKVICLTLVLFFSVDSNKTGHRSFYWSEWQPGDKPIGAVVAGKNAYIGRVYARQGILLASINFEKDVAVAIKNRKNVYRNGVEILCTHAKDQLYWEGVTVYNKSSTRVFQNAIRGGFHMSTSSTLYIGRIKLKQGARLGMVISPKKKEAGLWIYVKRKGYVRISEFQLLKYKMEECEAN